MAFENNDYFSLNQLVEAAELDQLSSRFNRLQREQVKAREGRQQLVQSCSFVKESADALSQLLYNEVSDRHQVQRHQDALARDCSRLLDTAARVSKADANLGALEASLRENISMLKTLITELAAKADFHIAVFSKEGSSSALQSWASDESIGDVELHESPLRDYHDSLSKESALKEQIDGIVIQQREMDRQMALLLEQGRPIPESDEQSYFNLQKCLIQLERDYELAQAVTEQCRTRCEELGVIEPTPQSLSNSTQQQEQQQAPAPKRVHQWLQQMATQEPPLEEIPYTRDSTSHLDQLDDMTSALKVNHCKSDSSLIDERDRPHSTFDESVFTTDFAEASASMQSFVSPGHKVESQANHDVYIDQNGHARTRSGDSSTVVVPSKHGANCVGNQCQMNVGNDDSSNVEGAGKLYSTPAHVPTETVAPPLHKLIWDGPANPNAQHSELSPSVENSLGRKKRKDYRRRPRSFYAPGTVFKVLNASIESSNSATGQESVITNHVAGYNKTGNHVLQQILWFVVVKAEAGYCRCLRITTNEGKGVTDLPHGQKKEHYSIIYTSDVAPEPLPGENQQRNDTGGMRTSVRVAQNHKWEKLDDMHRLHWTNIYAVLYNVRSVYFGKVHRESKMPFEFEFKNLHQRPEAGAHRQKKLRNFKSGSIGTQRFDDNLQSVRTVVSKYGNEGQEKKEE